VGLLDPPLVTSLLWRHSFPSASNFYFSRWWWRTFAQDDSYFPNFAELYDNLPHVARTNGLSCETRPEKGDSPEEPGNSLEQASPAASASATDDSGSKLVDLPKSPVKPVLEVPSRVFADTWTQSRLNDLLARVTDSRDASTRHDSAQVKFGDRRKSTFATLSNSPVLDSSSARIRNAADRPGPKRCLVKRSLRKTLSVSLSPSCLRWVFADAQSGRNSPRSGRKDTWPEWIGLRAKLPHVRNTSLLLLCKNSRVSDVTMVHRSVACSRKPSTVC